MGHNSNASIAMRAKMMSWKEYYTEGVLLLFDGRFNAAKIKLRQAYRLTLNRGDFDSARMAITHCAEAMLGAGEINQSKQLLVQSAQQMKEIFGANSTEYYLSTKAAAMHCIELMDYDLALELLGNMWQLLERLDAVISDAGAALILLQSYAHALNGDPHSALVAWQQKLDLMTQVLGDDNQEISTFLSIMETCYERIRQPGQANPITDQIERSRSDGKLRMQPIFDPTLIDFNIVLRQKGVSGFATRVFS
jgi:hypothetical protein